MITMHGSRIFWPGGSRPDCQETALTLLSFVLVLSLFYSFTVVYQRFISKKTIIYQGFRGVQLFSEVGINANLYKNP